MTDKPATTYVVSVFEMPHWRTVLTTTDINKALAKAKEIGDQVRIERRVQDGG
ncbi:hypothetical protein [Mesorhizobium kowhaii]|uniref:hypothetical protein n=1 Tax=Mesorhizobium kowhaii TaxID=1300272 RepID=UPI00142D827E|nr:hypothetical protein [Mesorhizobium kowhaii]